MQSLISRQSKRGEEPRQLGCTSTLHWLIVGKLDTKFPGGKGAADKARRRERRRRDPGESLSNMKGCSLASTPSERRPPSAHFPPACWHGRQPPLPSPPSSPHRHTQVTRAKSTFGSGGGMGCLAVYCDVVFRAVKVRLINKAASKHFCCTLKRCPTFSSNNSLAVVN